MKTYLNLHLEYLGKSEEVLCLQTEVNFIMDTASLKLPKRVSQEIVSCSADPKTGEVIMKYKDGHFQTFQEDRDPQQIAIRHHLLKMPFIPDQEYDGAKLSDQTYFQLQKHAYKKALWYQFNQLTDNTKRINMWINKMLNEYDQRLLEQRGIDLRNIQRPTDSDLVILAKMEGKRK